MEDLKKQDANVSTETTQDNFTADELAEQSSYDDSTQIAQEMRRGDEQNKETADDKDAAGSSKLEDWDQRQVSDK